MRFRSCCAAVAAVVFAAGCSTGVRSPLPHSVQHGATRRPASVPSGCTQTTQYDGTAFSMGAGGGYVGLDFYAVPPYPTNLPVYGVVQFTDTNGKSSSVSGNTTPIWFKAPNGAYAGAVESVDNSPANVARIDFYVYSDAVSSPYLIAHGTTYITCAPPPSTPVDVWALSSCVPNGDCSLYESLDTGKTYNLVPGGATKIALDQNEVAWAINHTGSIYNYASGAWQEVAGNVSDIAVGGSIIWVLSRSCDSSLGGCTIYESPDGGKSYKQVPGYATHIATDSSGDIWIVNSKSEIYRLGANGWTRMPGVASDIALQGSVIWVLSNDCNQSLGGCTIYRSTDTGSTYTQIPGYATSISADAYGEAWVTNAQENIYRYDSGSNGFVRMSGSATDLAAH